MIKKLLTSLRDWIEDNFFTIIIFLIGTFIIILTISLFTPIKVDDFPESSIELSKYNAAVNQRTILVRSISYMISGISVIIAFVSLIQNKKSELKRERLQVMPFPAYALAKTDSSSYLRTPTSLEVSRIYKDPSFNYQGEFEILIKNIGLGSLVDFQIERVCYQSLDDEENLDLSFFNNCILGKEESVQMAVNINTDFKSKREVEDRNLEKINFLVSFNDLLGHKYIQKFTIKFASELQETGSDKKVYSLKAREIIHTHPKEQSKKEAG